MPAQKRSVENPEEDSHQRHHYEEEDEEEEEEQPEEEEEEEEEEDGGGDEGGEALAAAEADEDDDRSPSSTSEEDDDDGEDDDDDCGGGGEGKDEFILVKLSEIRKEVQCPICLGIIRKTRTVMECLHRFCRECIDKSMRLGNNECPACRTHCASRRSLRDDPNYDSLIAALYPDIDKYEEEELAFREEEKVRNKQIQASIAQTFRRQTEALGRRRTGPKSLEAFMRKSTGYRRGRSSRNNRVTEHQGFDDDDEGNGNEAGRESSSADERGIDARQKRQKRWGPRFSQPSSAAANVDGGCDENDDVDTGRENTGAPMSFSGSPEVLAWGKGGVRSHTRYGSLNGSNGKNGRANRLAKLVDYLRNLEENDDKLDINLTLVPFDEQTIPRLERPYICCRPTLSIRQLCQFVALQTQLQAEEVEILAVKDPHVATSADPQLAAPQPSTSVNDPLPKTDPCKGELQLLEREETLSLLRANCTASQGHLVLTYRQKASSS
ncbi:hypothetical protein Syun_008498 [Stephania yunnanensis]|uniref:RING-type domain-containing protein n=1 Tax=Stephania yunnanensis TaxID=152371 RepID=A0AAP0PPN9_9MAGN